MSNQQSYDWQLFRRHLVTLLGRLNMLSPHQSKIEWIQAQWNDLPPHVQETITLLVDKCSAEPNDRIADEALTKQRVTRSEKTRRLYGLSRWLLKVLRHDPEAAGVNMDRDGWVAMEQIVNSLPNYLLGFSSLPYEFLVEVIEHILWQRVQLIGNSIRATYGHTTRLLDPVEDHIPDVPLFHGTSWELWPLIKHAGLTPAGRRFVQLTEDFDYANRIAQGRSANPLVLQVTTRAALDAGVKFFNFGIHVWQSTALPSCCLQQWSTNAVPNDFWLDRPE